MLATLTWLRYRCLWVNPQTFATPMATFRKARTQVSQVPKRSQSRLKKMLKKKDHQLSAQTRARCPRQQIRALFLWSLTSLSLLLLSSSAVAEDYGGQDVIINDNITWSGEHTNIGALIIEGPFPYKNGPAIWSDANPFGAYGMVIAPGTFDPEAGGQCTPLPPTSPFASSRLSPVKMTDSIKDCLIGCNWTAVQATGVDPCHAGSLPSGQGLSNSVMSCFDLGPGTEGHGGGACGYNCSLLRPNATDKLMGCTKADFGKCRVYCDSRTFPNANATARAWP